SPGAHPRCGSRPSTRRRGAGPRGSVPRRTPPRSHDTRRDRPAELLLGLLHGVAVGGEGGDEGLLRHLDGADVLHPLLALLLLLQQLALAGDVTAVALREDVLPDGADVLPGDDPRADRGLDRHLELLARDELLEL